MARRDVNNYLLGLTVVILLVGTSCADADVGSGSTPPQSSTTTVLTRGLALDQTNASCRHFNEADQQLPRKTDVPGEVRQFGQLRLTMLADALHDLDTIAVPPNMDELQKYTRQLLEASRALYEQIPTADDSQVDSLRNQAEELIRQVAVALYQAGAQDCVPAVRGDAPTSVSPDAGPLLARDPVAIISVGPPGVDDNRIVADGRSVWVGLKNLHQVVRIDAATNQVTTTLDIGGPPSSMQLVDGYVWVVTPNEVMRIEPAGFSIDRRMDRAGVGFGEEVRVTVGHDALFTCSDGVVRIASQVDGSLVRTARVATACESVLVGDHRTWTAGAASQQLVPFEPDASTPMSTINGNLGRSVPFGSDVFGFTGDRVQRFDTVTGKLTGEAPRGRLDTLQVATGDGAVWVTSPDDQRVIRVDAVTMALTELQAGPGVNAVAFADGTLWAANSDAGTVMRFDVADLERG